MTLNPNAFGPSAGLIPAEPFRYTEPVEAAPAEPSTRSYLIQLTLVGAVCGLIAGASLIAGLIGPGLMVIGLIFVGLTLWRVEMGLFIMAALVPWELQTLITPQISMIKAMGIIVAGIGLMKVFVSRGTPWPGMMKWALALGVWSTVSGIFNLSEPVMFYILSWATLLSNIAFMYLLMRFCSTPGAFRTLVWMVALSSVSAAVVGLMEYATPGLQARMHMGRLTTGTNANTYVRFLLPGIFLIPLLIPGVRSQLLRLALLPGIVFCIVAVVLTGSRGAALGAAAGALTMILCTRRIPLGTRIGLIVGLGLVAGGAYYFAMHLGAQATWQKRTEESSVQGAANIRIERWALALSMAADNPILGVGHGAQEGFAYVQKGYYWTESHNDVISSVIQGGFPGGVCFVGFLFAVFWGIWRLPPGIMKATLMGMWMAFVITGMFNPSLNKKVFWLAAGVISAAMVVHRSHSSAHPSGDETPPDTDGFSPPPVPYALPPADR